uniref:Uncharacterized protein n=1 Tax=viral metagenome TaxID=1070528 RepID=A0A6H1ZB21_9ZZZZ
MKLRHYFLSYHIWKSFKKYPRIITGYIDGTKYMVQKGFRHDSQGQYHKRKDNMITMSVFNKIMTIQFRDRKLPEY